MDYTTNSIKSLTTINSPNGVANTWSIGIASLFGLVVLFVAGACVGVYVVSRCRTSLKKTEIEKYVREAYRSSRQYGRWLL